MKKTKVNKCKICVVFRQNHRIITSEFNYKGVKNVRY